MIAPLAVAIDQPIPRTRIAMSALMAWARFGAAAFNALDADDVMDRETWETLAADCGLGQMVPDDAYGPEFLMDERAGDALEDLT